MPDPLDCTGRRGALRRLGAAGAAASLAWPALASSRRAALPPMTDGPFYPPPSWRAASTDWDADLTRVQRSAPVAAAQLSATRTQDCRTWGWSFRWSTGGAG